MQAIQTETISDAVADTLFIPLYMRYLETRRENGIIDDQNACRIVESVDYDFSKYDSQVRSQIGVCIRVRHFDRHTKSFLESTPNPVVINLGCGLDCRRERIGINEGIFYNVDLPEVMEIRDKLLPPDEQNISMHKSMFDPSWAEEIKWNHPGSQFLVISEGVFIYFTAEQVCSVFEIIASFLAPGEILCDALTDFGCKLSTRKHDTLKQTNASFRWGLNDDSIPEQWAPNIHLKNVDYYMNFEKPRWDPVARFMALFPFFTKAFKLMHYEISSLNLK